MVSPISLLEVLEFLKKAKSFSPGPDGYIYSDLFSKNFELSLLFKIILLTTKFPTCFKLAKTTLILKKARPERPDDFCPSYVSSVLSRTFFSVLAARVTLSFLISPTQRVFMPVDGCTNNIILLNSLVHEDKNQIISQIIQSANLLIPSLTSP